MTFDWFVASRADLRVGRFFHGVSLWLGPILIVVTWR